MHCLAFTCCLTGGANRDLADSVAVHVAGNTLLGLLFAAGACSFLSRQGTASTSSWSSGDFGELLGTVLGTLGCSGEATKMGGPGAPAP